MGLPSVWISSRGYWTIRKPTPGMKLPYWEGVAERSRSMYWRLVV